MTVIVTENNTNIVISSTPTQVITQGQAPQVVTSPSVNEVISSPNETTIIAGIEGLGDSFETVSKNLEAYPATLTYGGDDLANITYQVGALNIVKTFTYSAGNLAGVTLSGETPGGISLTKTFTYTGDALTGFSYS